MAPRPAYSSATPLSSIYICDRGLVQTNYYVPSWGLCFHSPEQRRSAVRVRPRYRVWCPRSRLTRASQSGAVPAVRLPCWMWAAGLPGRPRRDPGRPWRHRRDPHRSRSRRATWLAWLRCRDRLRRQHARLALPPEPTSCNLPVLARAAERSPGEHGSTGGERLDAWPRWALDRFVD
jgi:hypothetical protein